MRYDELDRLLSEEDGIAPSSAFAEAVMREIRREADTPQPIRFPWRLVLAGLILPILGVVIAMLTSSGVARSTRWTHVANAFGPSLVGLIASLWSPIAASLGLAAIVVLLQMAAYEWAMSRSQAEQTRGENRDRTA